MSKAVDLSKDIIEEILGLECPLVEMSHLAADGGDKNTAAAVINECQNRRINKIPRCNGCNPKCEPLKTKPTGVCHLLKIIEEAFNEGLADIVESALKDCIETQKAHDEADGCFKDCSEIMELLLNRKRADKEQMIKDMLDNGCRKRINNNIIDDIISSKSCAKCKCTECTKKIPEKIFKDSVIGKLIINKATAKSSDNSSSGSIIDYEL
jgi:hypothetical protein